MRNDFESNYLAHHGILGMKWGQRNGPPYPLDAGDHSSSEKKAGWRKSLAEKKKVRQGIKYKKEMQRLQTNIEYHKRERIRPLYVTEAEVGAKGLHKDIEKYRKAAKVSSGMEDWRLLEAEMEYNKTLDGLIKSYGSKDFMNLSNKSIERGQKKIDRLFNETKNMTESYERQKKLNDKKGDHSASEKKAGYKKSIGGGRNEELYSEKRKKKKEQQKQLANTVKELRKTDPTKVKDEVDKYLSDEQRSNLQEKFHKWSDSFEERDKFWKSKERREASNKAYDDALNYYKKNDPDQLSAWIKNNGGKSTNLDAFHDFRKVYEGYDDEYTSKAEEAYNKKHGIDVSLETKAWEDFENYSKEVAESLVGKYGRQKIEKSQQFGRINLDATVRGAVEQLAYKKKK